MISVCMATYNGSEYLKEQLDSILLQLGINDELIISDDGSTDRTIEIINDYVNRDKRIKLFHGPRKGLVSNFENALIHSSGDFIFLSDQDDVWCLDKVSVMSELLKSHSLVVSDCVVVDKNKELLFSSFYELNGLRVTFFSNLVKNSFLGCCMAFKREVLVKSLPFPRTVPMHDWWIGLCATSVGNIYFTPEKLVMYRRHGLNASPTSEKSRYSLSKKVQFRMVLTFNLLRRFFYD